MKLLWKIAVPTGCVILILVAALGWHFFRKRVNARRLNQEATVIRRRAEQGDATAETELGHLYYRGLGVARDYAEAATWFEKAANQGQAKSQYGLGYMDWYGQGVPEDKIAAVKWYRKAADQGYALAESALGSSYYYRQGVQQDRAKAAYWYRKSADHGIAEAKYDLAYMLDHGEGIAQNRAEADRLFHQAADQGDENARRTLHLTRGSPSAWNKATLSMIFAGSLLLLIGSLFKRQRRRSREGRVIALAGFFGLVYAGLDFERYFRYGIPPFSSAETFLYFAWALMGGVSLAMLFVGVLFQKSAKSVIVISCVLFVAFGLVFVLYARSSQIQTIQPVLVWFIGTGITSAVLLWMERRRGGGIAKSEDLAG